MLLNVLASSSIWTCRILNIEYLFAAIICHNDELSLFSTSRHSGKKQNNYSKFKIQNSKLKIQNSKFDNPNLRAAVRNFVTEGCDLSASHLA
jgi:hypothetical protein